MIHSLPPWLCVCVIRAYYRVTLSSLVFSDLPPVPGDMGSWWERSIHGTRRRWKRWWRCIQTCHCHVIHGSRISKVRNSGGEPWRSTADVAEHNAFSKATKRRRWWFSWENSDEQSCFCLVTAPQVCFAHWWTPTPRLIDCKPKKVFNFPICQWQFFQYLPLFGISKAKTKETSRFILLFE